MNRLRELRDEKGWTQEDLGKILQVQKAAVSKYETERVPLTGELIQQFCEIFDVSADYLLGISDIRDRSATTSEVLKMALFGDREVDDEVLDAVQRFAAFTATEKKKNTKTGEKG